MELTVDVTADYDGGSDGDNIGLFSENLFSLGNKKSYFLTELFNIILR